MARPRLIFWKRLSNHIASLPNEKMKEDCLCWTGCLTNTGYGRISRNHDEKHFSSLVHRQVYQRLHGPIPDGLQVDHICKNTTCCNPKHLRLLSVSENLNNREFKHGS